VYLASTLPALSAALQAGSLESPLGFAVTPALREWYTEGDDEELEYAATLAAARASLRRLAGADAAPRRVVLAADVPDRSVRPALDVDRAAVRLDGPVSLSQVASALVDDPAAVADVRRALSALAAADAGDEDAAFTVDSVEDHELGWYAAQELSALVELEG
jgi:hypothetical protein